MSTRLPEAAYFSAFSTRFSNTRSSSSRSPSTSSGSAGAVTSTSTPRSRASICRPSTTWRTIGDQIDLLVRAQMRVELDARQRQQVVDQPRHAGRLRLHDGEEALARRASSRAGPCKVSMKPESAASGVRSSWLALATKSARISSTRRSGVRSWNAISTSRRRVRRRAGDRASRSPRTSARPARARRTRRAGRRCRARAADRVEDLGNAQRQRHRLAAPQRRRDRAARGR